MNKINQGVLKYIAMISMIIDHTGVLLIDYLPNWLYDGFRMVGRISFPLFCFCIVEGFVHTKSFPKYVGKIAIFAVISEIPFNLLVNHSYFYLGANNVLITFVIGLFVLFGLSKITDTGIKGLLLALLTVTIGMGISYLLKTDYSWKGILLITIFYMARNDKAMIYVGGTIMLWLNGTFIDTVAPLAFIPIHFYNGERGRQLRYLFYVFYPAHLLVLGLIGMYIL